MRVDAFEIWRRASSAKDQRSSDKIPDGYPKWRHKSSNAAIWIPPTRLMMRDSGKTMSIHLEDIAVVGDRSCGCISLIDRPGRTREIDVDEWKGGKKLRSKLLEVLQALSGHFPKVSTPAAGLEYWARQRRLASSGACPGR